LRPTERIAGERKTDLLFPTQKQVTALSARRKYLGVATKYFMAFPRLHF
jgi:hypothetical protein